MGRRTRWLAAAGAGAMGLLLVIWLAGKLAGAASLGDAINAGIDDLMAAGSRILELPLFMLLGAAIMAALACALGVERLGKHPRQAKVARMMLIAAGVLAAFAISFLADRRIAHLQDEVVALRGRLADAMARADHPVRQSAPASRPGPRSAFLFDLAAARKSLETQFVGVMLRPSTADDATDLVQVQMTSPMAQAYLAIIDLRHPRLEIKVDDKVEGKWLTSDFVRRNGCTVAINGEAGISPRIDAPLDVFQGNLVHAGREILRENPGYPRPFLSFDRQNRPSYTTETARSRALPPDSYNLIWGRSDAIVGGRVWSEDWRNRQPRTTMAINQDGSHLYLLVVDGRQSRYSMGMTRPEVGQVLKAFGAYDGMFCDEGGSSCIYTKQAKGIWSRPCDPGGRERPTYTHFGVTLTPES